MYLHEIKDTDVGPELVVSKEPFLSPKICMFASLVDSIELVDFIHLASDPICVFFLYGTATPIPSVVRLSISTMAVVVGYSRRELHDQIATFWGYSRDRGMIQAHFTRDMRHISVDVTHLTSMKYLREGSL